MWPAKADGRCAQRFPCRPPPRYLPSGSANPIGKKALCVERLCARGEVDAPELHAGTTRVETADASQTTVRVHGSVRAGTASCEPVRLHVGAEARVRGDVEVYGTVEVRGAAVRTARQSALPVMQGAGGVDCAWNFFLRPPTSFVHGRSEATVIGLYGTAGGTSLLSPNSFGAVRTVRVRGLALQSLQTADNGSVVTTYVRAAPQGSWGLWRRLQDS